MVRTIDTGKAAGDVRAELDQIYHFNDSKSVIYTFNPFEPRSRLTRILESAGMSPKEIEDQITGYRENKIGASSVYTEGRFGFDYIILVPSGVSQEDEFFLKISEEIMHGEHYNIHKGSGDYISIFSEVAREFFGGSGRCHIASKYCVISPGKYLPDGFCENDPEYEEETDTYYFDLPHLIGYRLSRQAFSGEDSWKRAMFHEPE